MNDLRLILAFPFGLLAETFARLTILISDNQLNVDFRYLCKNRYVTIIPIEVLDLLRFMCAVWTDIDKWAYEHCDVESLMHYPIVQGIRNKIKLQRIGEQPYDTQNISKAVEWLQRYSAELTGCGPKE